MNLRLEIYAFFCSDCQNVVPSFFELFASPASGVFVLKYSEYLTRLAAFSFTQKDMPLFRRRMVFELVAGHVLYP